MLHYCSLLHFY